MIIKRYVPNAITLLNLLSGCIAVIYAVNDNFIAAAFFVFLGIFFDFFDGFFARLFKVQSPLGVQLDSLADMITSGLVPGIVMFKLLSLTLDNQGLMDTSNEWGSNIEWVGFKLHILPILGLFITLASAYRLAKFNIDENQQDSFIGLPTPANALLILSLPLIMEFQNNDAMNAIILNKWFLIGLTIVSCYLLNANIKLFALKFKDWSFTTNATRYIFIILSAVMLIVLKFAAIPLIIAVYIIMSVLNSVSSKS